MLTNNTALEDIGEFEEKAMGSFNLFIFGLSSDQTLF